VPETPSTGGGELKAQDAALLGAGVPAGWSLLDFAFFLPSGDARVVYEILPASLALVLAGAVLGLAFRRLPRLSLVMTLVVLFGSSAFKLAARPDSQPAVTLTRAAFCGSFALLAFCVAAFSWRRLALRAFRVGFVAGLLGAMAMAAMRHGTVPNWMFFLPGAAAVLASGWVRPSHWRWVLSSLAVALPLLPAVSRARERNLLRPDLAPPSASASGASPNLLLIVLDTVRADHIGAYGYERGTTPVLDAFARDHATLFEEVRATSSWTLPSHASMFTGLLPAEHGADHPRRRGAETVPVAVRPAQKLGPDVTTLAEGLREKGYRTGAIVANWAYLDHRFGLDRGFEHYDARRSGYVGKYRALPQLLGQRLRAGHVAYRDAGTISRLALSWLESVRGERPFFLVLNYMDAHEPCFPPAPFDREFGPRQPVDPLEPEKRDWSLVYDRALRYADSEVGRLLSWLVERGLFDRTAVIITSDHGEAFGDHDYWGHAWDLHEELLRVPLLAKPAGRRVKTTEERALSVADIHDLALSLTGLRGPDAYQVRPLAAEWYHGKPNPEIREWATRVGRDVRIDLVTWVDEGRKYIVGSDGSVKAFDLPDEFAPVALAEDKLERARAKAFDWWRAHPPRGQDTAPLDEEEAERLKALGYVQ
jgi:arylsulfatase A-like enzyme